jgi:voltage-gated potassium channel
VVRQTSLGAADHPAAIPASAAVVEPGSGSECAAQRAVGQTIRGKVIVYTACGAVAIVYAASLAILDVEGRRPESKIHTLGDALWWATTTVTTVGYADLSPVTPTGKLVAVALMIGGIALVGSVTATLAR